MMHLTVAIDERWSLRGLSGLGLRLWLNIALVES